MLSCRKAADDQIQAAAQRPGQNNTEKQKGDLTESPTLSSTSYERY